jgi:hypothetical protein
MDHDENRVPPEDRDTACPRCKSNDATVYYTATVACVVEDGSLTRVIVHDDSATGPSRVRCSGCGHEEVPSVRALVRAGAKPYAAAIWADAHLALVDDESGWPDWQIGSW